MASFLNNTLQRVKKIIEIYIMVNLFDLVNVRRKAEMFSVFSEEEPSELFV